MSLICEALIDNGMTVLCTFVGSLAGGGIVVWVDYLIKQASIKNYNFNQAISIQLALNQMLALLLQTYDFYRREEERINSDESIKKYKHIFLGRFENYYPGINFDWELSQFFSKFAGLSREVLKKLIPARATYLEIDRIIRERNDLHLEAFNKIEILERMGVREEFLFQDNNLKEKIGILLYKRLEDLTNRYFENIELTVKDVFQAFNDLSAYVKDNFNNYEPLKLSLESNARESLGNICK